MEENRRIFIDAIRITIQAKVTRTTNKAMIGRFDLAYPRCNR